jgi:hypothetical protein
MASHHDDRDEYITLASLSSSGPMQADRPFLHASISGVCTHQNQTSTQN